MEEHARRTLVERNVSLLKEADAERDALNEVGRGMEAEQARKVRRRCNALMVSTDTFWLLRTFLRISWPIT